MKTEQELFEKLMNNKDVVLTDRHKDHQFLSSFLSVHNLSESGVFGGDQARTLRLPLDQDEAGLKKSSDFLLDNMALLAGKHFHKETGVEVLCHVLEYFVVPQIFMHQFFLVKEENGYAVKTLDRHFNIVLAQGNEDLFETLKNAKGYLLKHYNFEMSDDDE